MLSNIEEVLTLPISFYQRDSDRRPKTVNLAIIFKKAGMNSIESYSTHTAPIETSEKYLIVKFGERTSSEDQKKSLEEQQYKEYVNNLDTFLKLMKDKSVKVNENEYFCF